MTRDLSTRTINASLVAAVTVSALLAGAIGGLVVCFGIAVLR